jgi:alpha-beta hydrolase superfamily lysophospholipase
MKDLSITSSLLALLCAAAPAGAATVKFNTTDGCALEAFYLAPSSGAYILVNTHGLGSDRNEWAGFQDALAGRGLGYLSLDLRGHGTSRKCRSKKADYRSFTKADWDNASRDITAAAAWLKKKGFPAKQLIFCGASIGANLSLKAAAESVAKPAAVILLSPGLDYAGIRPEDYLARLPHEILILAAKDDTYAWKSASALSLAAGRKGLSAAGFDGGSGHGVNMFRTPGMITKILDWISGL